MIEGVTFFFEWEVAFLEWMQGYTGPVLLTLASFFTMFGEEITVIGLLGFLYWCYDKELGKFVWINAMLAFLAGTLTKSAVLRRRPYMDHPGIECLRAVHPGTDIQDISIQGYSFPSLHAASSMNFYASLLLSMKKWFWVIGGILVLGIGFSRMILGVHYPTDVFVGWLVGGGMTVVGCFLQKWIRNYLVFAGIFVFLGIPGWFYCGSQDFYTIYGIGIGSLLAFHIEEKLIHFANTRSIIGCILRIAGGMAVFLLLSAVLKLLFSAEPLLASDFAEHLIRVLRYGIAVFVSVGLYPYLFRYMPGNTAEKAEGFSEK